jgi:hypothetical protein
MVKNSNFMLSRASTHSATAFNKCSISP